MDKIFFDNKEDAQNLINLINIGEGIPNETGLTKTYCEYFEENGKFFIFIDDVVKKYIEIK
jgi:hypothetical protein